MSKLLYSLTELKNEAQQNNGLADIRRKRSALIKRRFFLPILAIVPVFEDINKPLDKGNSQWIREREYEKV